jgi:energy-coupling factor transporter ATP-binding protein EcfA2
METRISSIESAYQGTCEWLPCHRKFQEWKASAGDILWIKGKPGSGKSTLMKHAWNLLESPMNSRFGALRVSFFVHGRGSELQHSSLGLYRTMLFQLLPHVANDELARVIPDFWRWYRQCTSANKLEEHHAWSIPEIEYSLNAAVAAILRTTSLLLWIDALDELGEESAVKVLEFLRDLTVTAGTLDMSLHICVACRHYPLMDDICDSQILVEDQNQEDIRKWIRNRLARQRRQASMGEIEQRIVDRARGVFLWVRLVIKAIEDLIRRGNNDDRQILKQIDHLPRDLEMVFKELIERIEDKEASLKLMQWICHAKRPLTLNELRWAMVIDTDRPLASLAEYEEVEGYKLDHESLERAFNQLSCGLVEVVEADQASTEIIPHHTSHTEEAMSGMSGDLDEEVLQKEDPTTRRLSSRTVQFIHQTVKDYITEKGLAILHRETGQVLNASQIPSHAHLRLWKAVALYLATAEVTKLVSRYREPVSSWHDEEGLRDLSQALQETPLLLYAVDAWIFHIQHCDFSRAASRNILNFLGWPSRQSRLPVRAWLRAYRWPLATTTWDARIIPIGYVEDWCFETVLHIASFLGLPGLMLVILEDLAQGPDSNSQNSSGKHNSARWSVHGSVSSATRIGTRSRSVLDVRRSFGVGAQHGSVPLTSANMFAEREIEREHEEVWDPESQSEIIAVKELVQCQFAKSWSPISLAIVGRQIFSDFPPDVYVDIVRMLLDAGARVDVLDLSIGYDQTLFLATRYGDDLLIRMMLAAATGTAAANMRSRQDQTPLEYAVMYGTTATCQILLPSSRQVMDRQDQNGRTPLWLAVWCGNIEMISAILKQSTQAIDIPDFEGQTPIYIAASQGQAYILELLLKHSSRSLHRPSHDGTTPLCIGIRQANRGVIRVLLHAMEQSERGTGSMESVPLLEAALKEAYDSAGSSFVAGLLADYRVQSISDLAKEMYLRTTLSSTKLR